MKKIILFVLSTVAGISGYSQGTVTIKNFTYQNIIILADLSSRTKSAKFPQKDTAVIRQLVSYFKNDCVMPGKKIGDNSSISFSPFSLPEGRTIDLESFRDLGDKQRFINSKGKYKNAGLQRKLDDLEGFARMQYKTVSNPGMDLISLLIERIEGGGLIKKDHSVTIGDEITRTHFSNHIYILTDGYLEFKFAGNPSNEYYFGVPQIEKLRKFCVAKGLTPGKALEANSSLGLKGYASTYNRLIDLHVLETAERDKDLIYLTYSHPKGLRDNEILEAVWRKWAKDSGFRSLEWKKY
ncbi:hypothetical protein D0C36_15865 [Mucilaginibacter conchicola]|uniref:VWA domain-containing protein n=1 Tax=Mucilaginibacter conchicola TaxID=2303333 RepID=A0A372NUF4_9SPHI|nr:hypothetical protein [Mucilaginibacter conchicola]RFZ92866.1 hypothetical protein D0C36_15865 [Mucilaginibacter conchicola]